MGDPAASKGLIGPLIHRCQKCKAGEAREKFLRCRYCRAVRYCSIEHLRADRSSHKSACKGISKARVKLAKEDRLVRSLPADGDMPANVFETGVGKFWHFQPTRDYLRTRYILVERLHTLGTLDSYAQALKHMHDMMRLDRADHLDVQDIAPYVMLSLDLDQESCDFIKGWGIQGRKIVKGTDIFESADSILGVNNLYNPKASSLLLRLKLLVDVINVMNARKVLPLTPLPVEIQIIIEKNMVRSPLSAHLHKESTQALVERRGKLVRGILEFSQRLADDHNESFMFEFFHVALSVEPRRRPGLSYGEREAVMARRSYPAWRGTEGVLQLLDNAGACAMKTPVMNLKGMLYSYRDKLGQRYSRSAAEQLKYEILEVIWDYLPWAVEDATYLGPPAERPSERYRKLENERVFKNMEGMMFQNEHLKDAMRGLASGNGVCE
ncbi:unnamed protein product [Clonostachys solani]|uniref:MYND-type domain-containing protein n=1 Tax=Clonostachys solani TaxID=160281 RepID=A0A9N9ZMY1_9HYPO|nr:unnamed protein product [Clonostachys solani]